MGTFLFWCFAIIACIIIFVERVNYYNRPIWKIIREERLRAEAEERRKPKRGLKRGLKR